MNEIMLQNLVRRQVLVLYKKILRVSRSWTAISEDLNDTNEERKYIVNEARTLFRKNKDLTDPNEIQFALKEGEMRFELALHYQNPYPRPVNVPPLAVARLQGKKFGKGQTRKRSQAKPVYIRSSDEYDKT